MVTFLKGLKSNENRFVSSIVIYYAVVKGLKTPLHLLGRDDQTDKTETYSMTIPAHTVQISLYQRVFRDQKYMNSLAFPAHIFCFNQARANTSNAN